MKILKISAVLALLAASSSAWAQTSIFAEFDNAKKTPDKIKVFSDTIKDLTKAAAKVNSIQGIDRIEKQLGESDFRYDLFFKTSAEEISSKEELQAKLLDYQAARQSLVDSLTVWRSRFEARESFENAGIFLASQDSTYRAMYKLSNKLSITSQTAKALEKLKAREQLRFAEVQSKYDEACSAIQVDPSLSEGFEALESNYIELKSYSVKIQQAQYKPFIERIKDYLLSIAAVTIILMFIVMIKGQITSAKQYRDNMKKMQEQFKKKDNEIPSI